MRFNTTKIVNLLSFLLILIMGFTLLYIVHASHSDTQFSASPIIVYALILFIITVSLIQLILNNIFKVEKEETAMNDDSVKLAAIEKKIEEKKDEPELKETETEQEESKLNTKEILTRVIPQKLPTPEEFGDALLISLSKEFDIVQGIFHLKNLSDNLFSSIAFYAYFSETKPESFAEGVTLPGQVARSKEVTQIEGIPEDYIRVLSGLGESNTGCLTFIPVFKDEMVVAVIELASFKKFDEDHLSLFREMANKLATTIYNYIKGTEKNKNDKE